MRGVEPLRLRTRAQPRELTLRKLSRRHNCLFTRLVHRAVSCQISPYLAISDRAHRRMFRGQIVSFPQDSNFLEKSRSQHRLEPRLETRVQDISVERRQGNFEHLDARQHRYSRLLQPRDGLSRQFVHLERTLNALWIVDVNP